MMVINARFFDPIETRRALGMRRFGLPDIQKKNVIMLKELDD
jgi:hypothetical protein